MRVLTLRDWEEAVGRVAAYDEANDAVELDMRAYTARVPMVNVREQDVNLLRHAIGERVAILNVPDDKDGWRARLLEQEG